MRALRAALLLGAGLRAAVALEDAPSCVYYVAGAGKKYDLCPLAHESPFKVTVPQATGNLYATFGVAETVTCRRQGINQAVYGMQTFSATDDHCVQPFGNGSSITAVLLGEVPEDGVVVQYTGGQGCMYDRQPYTQLRISCDPSVMMPEPSDWQAAISGCGLIVSVAARVGCPLSLSIVEQLGWGWTFLISFGALVCLYLGIGVLYKRLQLKASGVEAIPNIEFWRLLLGLAWDGLMIVTCDRCGQRMASLEFAETAAGRGGGGEYAYGQLDDDDPGPVQVRFDGAAASQL